MRFDSFIGSGKCNRCELGFVYDRVLPPVALGWLAATGGFVCPLLLLPGFVATALPIHEAVTLLASLFPPESQNQ